MMDYGMYDWGGHWPGGALMMIFWVLVVVGLTFLAGGALSHSSAGPAGAPENPQEILKSRYAKGEIDKVEFEQRKKDLLGS